MKKSSPFLPIALAFAAIVLLACGPIPAPTPPRSGTSTPVAPTSPTSPTATETPEITPDPASTGFADVIFVKAVQAEDGTWTFYVTVRSPDTGWDNYADGWDVVTPDGQVIKVNSSDAFTRVLLHPHENEQPFTRSQQGLVIPPGVTKVIVRAHQNPTGYGGREVIVDLTKPAGPDFEVQRALPSESRAAPLAAYTYPRPDGNHWAAGQGRLPELAPLDIPLEGKPVWVVGLPWGDGILWAVTLENGRVQGVYTVNKQAKPYRGLTTSILPVGMPPVLYLKDGRPDVLTPPDEASPLTHPVLIPSGMAYIATNGDLVIRQGGTTTRLPINALPDARLLYDGEGHLLLLAEPTQRYAHGALGDPIEAGRVLLVNLEPPAVQTQIVLPESQVVEGIAPLWADLNGDGQREIVLTQSEPETGAQFVVYGQDGERLGEGKAIGQGFRWRHGIAVAPFAPGGDPELVGVLTPHIGGPVEFFRWEESALRLVAQVTGYTSHVIRSRNMDMAVAGDFDGLGRPGLLLPNQARTELGMVRRTDAGAEIAWTLPLSGMLSTNLSAVTTATGRLALAVGQLNGSLRVWQE